MANSEPLSFWDHLEALRGVLLRIVAAVAIGAVVCFCFKDLLFNGVVLAPLSAEFPTYRLIATLGRAFGLGTELSPIPLINTGVTRQLFIHMTMSLWMAVLLTSPYTIYALFNFVAPALYQKERTIGTRLVGGAYGLFIVGVLVGYFIIFPVAFRFLATYQVSASVQNLITLQSYVDTLSAITLLMGLLFQLPIVCLLLAKAGIISAPLMSRYHRHALVAILVVAAVITPTTDPFTLALVSIPIYLLYLLSIHLVARSTKKPVRT